MYTFYKVSWFSRYAVYRLIILVLAVVYGVCLFMGYAAPVVMEVCLFVFLSLFLLVLSLREGRSVYGLSEEEFIIDGWLRHLRLELREVENIRTRKTILGEFMEIQSLRGKFIIPLSSLRDHASLYRIMTRRLARLGDTEREELHLDD